jgi:sugar lactone lactonase YvrE
MGAAGVGNADQQGDNRPKIFTIASTVPQNGDLNPYGVAIVSRSTGNLTQGHILVSNFNNSSNLQGTGTTIMDIAANGTANVFAQINASALPGPCPGGVGLTTALVVLRSGWVIVGSLPTMDGTAATAQAGCLLVLDSGGHVVETITDTTINGPWDMTALDLGSRASLFVTNVLNGTVAAGGSVVNQGTVLRINLDLSGAMPAVTSITTIGSGFPERTDPAALVIGPTGVGLAENGTLYVADSLTNRIAAISNAVTRSSSANIGRTVSMGGSLNDPLGLAIGSDNGDIFTTNGNNGLLVQTSPDGEQKNRILLDHTGTPPGAGTLFGLATIGSGVFFVDDGSNTLNFVLDQDQQ